MMVEKQKEMTSFEAYCLYMSLKMHFTSSSYDFFKYNGKVNAKVDAFERRRDKYFFQKLAKKRNLQDFLVANFIKSDVQWVGDLISDDAEANYAEWQKRHESLTYMLRTEIEQLEDEFISFFRVKGGQHPKLLTMYAQGKISLETLTVLNDILDFFPIWDKKIVDPVIWPSVRDKSLKYRQFIHYDRAKTKTLVKSLMTGA